MKKLLFSAFLTTSFLIAQGQVKIPAASPSADLKYTVGLTDIELQYSRPNKKDRVIFGDLVPYGKIWRTGANKNTTISFSDDVMIGGKSVKAGKYAIYTKPEKDKWEIYFYADTENWGNPEKWDDSKVVAKVTEKVTILPFSIETLSITIGDLKDASGKLGFLWDNVYVETKIEVPTDQKVLSSIDASLKGSPKMEDYFSAAVYYFNSGKDIKQSKEWIDKAMEMNTDPQFYHFRQQSLIYAKAGDKKGALSLAKKSLDAAKKAGNDDYVKMNEDSIKEWSK